ncbi:hypothetical protein ASF61_04195 [Duganella sp. Leaf126]|uniref:hypothetical protein n=1 Tax=Duganella sp. Leaf126 TaxID=1736266 RepID=UPI0006FDF636|nr:hypothetical protein [Duganella sp. Leaf126]KQQ40013.1 hypothetical protein ASF61_04195 [Duganella sp. Leaf126]
MANIPALGARNLPANYYPASPRTEGKSANSPATQKTGEASSLSRLSNNALDMQQRVASLGNATVDFAQDFVSSFTQALFGDDAKGATIDFDSASLEASSSYAVGVQRTSDANGVRTLAGLSLTDSAHFIGKGTITTADGRKFDFEVEVKYDAQLSAAAGSQTGKPGADKADATPQNGNPSDLPTVKVPNIDFPGTLADLFQLIGRDLQSALATNGDRSDQTGDNIDRNTLRGLSLRLLNLVDSKHSDTYTAPSAADKAKSAAAYGELAPADDVTMPVKAAPDAATAAPAPAATDAATGAETATATPSKAAT